MSSSTNIVPRNCSFGCQTRIYWDNSQSTFLEVFSKQKHICKNRSINNTSGNLPQMNNTNTNRPYYNKKPWIPKPKMDNSLEVIQGTISEVTSKYEILTDLIRDYNGKTHGSQSHINGNVFSLVVYYEIPEGKRVELKQRFNNFIRTVITLPKN